MQQINEILHRSTFGNKNLTHRATRVLENLSEYRI